jgi:hypothetical protein
VSLLTAPEVVLLTGYKMPCKQIAFLRSNAIPFIVNARGRPVVPADVLTKRATSRPQLGLVP